MTDLQLHTWINQAIAGDHAAFESLYEHTLDDVYRTVTFLVSNSQDVQDIVSEVYIQLWHSLPNYDPGRPFHFWLHGLVVKQVNSWRRGIWRRFRLLERSHLQEEPQSESIERAVLLGESAEELLSVIGKLSYKLRVVIVYRYFHDYSLDQIATMLQIPVGTVKSRHHLALKEIRKRYATLVNGKVGTQDAY